MTMMTKEEIIAVYVYDDEIQQRYSSISQLCTDFNEERIDSNNGWLFATEDEAIEHIESQDGC